MAIRTHTNEMIKETHDKGTVMVRRRTNHETVRLQLLAATLDHPNTRLFTVERKLAHSNVIAAIPVEAINGAEAASIADEVKYALDYMRAGGRGYGKEPESWAVNMMHLVEMRLA